MKRIPIKISISKIMTLQKCKDIFQYGHFGLIMFSFWSRINQKLNKYKLIANIEWIVSLLW